MGVALALWFFTANDDATTSAPPAVAAPGVAWDRPTPHPGDVARGNVVVAVEHRKDAPDARRLADEVAGGPATPALRAAGQAVEVDVPTGFGEARETCTDVPTGKRIACPTVHAYAHRRIFSTTSATDPALRAFVEYWLGRASG